MVYLGPIGALSFRCHSAVRWVVTKGIDGRKRDRNKKGLDVLCSTSRPSEWITREVFGLRFRGLVE